MSDFQETGNNKKNTLPELLERLVKASESGDFNVALDPEHLDGEDAETIRLINKAVSNYKNIAEHKQAMSEKIETILFESNKTLEILKSILNYSEAMICVNDVDESNIMYITDSMKRHFGIEDDVTGQTCYKVLYADKNERCDWCPCHQLEKESGKVVIWNERNIRTGGYYRNMDRYATLPDGKKVHIHHRVDLTENKKIQDNLEKQYGTVNFLHEMGTMLLELDNTQPNLIVKSMGLVGRFVNADRIHIWRNEFIDGVAHFTLNYKWVDDSAQKFKPAPMGRVLPATPRNWDKELVRGGYVNKTLSDDCLPHEREFMNRYDIKSISVIPLFFSGKFWGVLSADVCRNEHVFSEDEINNMTAAGRLVLSAITRHEMFVSIQAERNKHKELSHWYESILDTVPHAITVTDMDMKYVFANRVTEKTLWKTRNDLVGMPCNNAGAPICDTEDCSVVRAKRGLKRTYFKRDGLSFRVDTEGLYDLNGKITAFVEVIQDITEIEKMAEKQASVEAASEAKTRFLANMSHEIRTPINSIIGFTELALDTAISPKTIEYIKMINKNSELLMQIVNDILDISKVESGNMELETIPFNLRALYESCLSIMSPKAKEKNIKLILDAQAYEKEKVLGDPTRLSQVLINLLSNAVKFTHTGSVLLSVALESATEQSATMRFKINDTGIGMTSEQLQTVLEPFVQADLSTMRVYGGTGLGLTIAKNLVEIMGGRLEIESAPGVGTTVSFTLTFDTTEQPDETINNNVVKKLDKPVFEGNILVCEDNEMNQWVIREHLERVGFQVVIAENGSDGINKIRERIYKGEKPFDLIFMDIHMPVMGGIEAVPSIIELDTGTPIVALTANIMFNDRERYKTLGMKDCIAKPFTSQELYRCLLKHLKPIGFADAGKGENKKEIKLQNRLKKDFVKNNQRKFDEITEAIAAGDIALAHRLAHTLKSTAGLIYRTNLQSAAAEVETALKNGENKVTETQITALRSELSATLNELARCADETADISKNNHSEAATGVYNAEKTRELFEKLEPLLNSGNLESLNYVDALRPIPESGELIGQIEELYFDEAVNTLVELKEKMGENLWNSQ